MVTFDKSDYIIALEVTSGKLSPRVLRCLIQETVNATENLDCENEVLLHYINRHCISQDSTDVGGLVQKHFPMRMKPKSGTIERFQGLSLAQKYNVVATEGDFIGQNIKMLIIESEKTIANYRAILECCAMRKAEIKKLYGDFDAAVLHGDYIYGTTTPKAESFLRYHEKFSLNRDNIILQCKLKNPLLRDKIRKLQVEIKRTTSEANQPKRIDFEMMRQQNLQCAEYLEERSKLLVDVKLTSCRAIRLLHNHKENVMKAVAESQMSEKQFQKRTLRLKAVNAKLETDKKKFEVEDLRRRRVLDRKRSYRVPSVFTFAENQAMLKSLEHESKNALREKYITQLIYKQKLLEWLKICQDERFSIFSRRKTSLPYPWTEQN